MKTILAFACRGGALALLLTAAGPSYSAALFDAEATLEVVIEAPMGELSKRRHDEPELGGTLRYTDASGTERTLPVSISTRGKTRLEICDFPPLRLTFDPADTAGTPFDGQHKLKMVRPCMRGRDGRDWVYLELGAYRAYRVITDYSFRARQLNVTFRDTESFFRRVREQPAFLLEDDSDLAKRLDRERIRPLEVKAWQMALPETTHYVLFQYLIGNTDFALRRGPRGEECCHNGRVIANPGSQNAWIVVPYDFDYAGLVDTDYAVPHEALPIKKVTSRLYRGFCWQNEALPASIDLVNRKRAELEAALIPSELSNSKARRARNYVKQFYRIVNDPQARQDELLDNCRGPDSVPPHNDEKQ